MISIKDRLFGKVFTGYNIILEWLGIINPKKTSANNSQFLRYILVLSLINQCVTHSYFKRLCIDANFLKKFLFPNNNIRTNVL